MADSRTGGDTPGGSAHKWKWTGWLAYLVEFPQCFVVASFATSFPGE
jgi:hypothetical protein